MAFVCTELEVPEEIKCMLDPCIGESQRMALRVYFLRLAYIALGGSEEEIDAVIEGSRAMSVAISEQQISAAYAALYATLAEDLGAEMPTAEEVAGVLACGACTPNQIAIEIAVLCRVLALLSENCRPQ